MSDVRWDVQLLLKHPQLITALKQAIKAVDEFEQMRRQLVSDADMARLEFQGEVWAKLLDPSIEVAGTVVDWLPAEQPTPRPIEHVLAEIARKA